MRKDKIAKIRLQDANLREGREDPKRVYLCVDKISKEAWVEISFVEVSDKIEERFEFLKGALFRLNEEGVAVPEVRDAEKSAERFTLQLSYEGRGLLGQLKNKEIAGEIDLAQVDEIFRKMGQIDKEKGEFIVPRPIEKFFEVIKSDEFKEEHEGEILAPLQELQDKFEDFLDGFAPEYRYGWGVIDPDIINFTVKKEKDGYKISLIDIDGLRGSYDFYYQAGYFWTSLERLSDKSLTESKREEFESALSFGRKGARKRYQLGKAAALSLVLFSKPKELGQEGLKARIGAIDEVLRKA